MRYLAVGLLLSLPATLLPQQPPPPKLLVDAAQCLATSKEDWLSLGRRKANEVEMGFVTDTKSYPGEQLLYIVNFTTPLHTSGLVATFLADGKEPHLTLRLQYKVNFRQSDDGSQRVELINPPFGGISTQERVISAVHQVEQRTWTIPLSPLVTQPNVADCESDAPTQ